MKQTSNKAMNATHARVGVCPSWLTPAVDPQYGQVIARCGIVAIGEGGMTSGVIIFGSARLSLHRLQ